MSFHEPRLVNSLLSQHEFAYTEDIDWPEMRTRYVPGVGYLEDPLGVHVAHGIRQ